MSTQFPSACPALTWLHCSPKRGEWGWLVVRGPHSRGAPPCTSSIMCGCPWWAWSSASGPWPGCSCQHVLCGAQYGQRGGQWGALHMSHPNTLFLLGIGSWGEAVPSKGNTVYTEYQTTASASKRWFKVYQIWKTFLNTTTKKRINSIIAVFQSMTLRQLPFSML